MKKIAHARSKKNGIVFYSDTISGLPGLALNAFVDKDGKIQTKIRPQILMDFVDFLIEEKEHKTFLSNELFLAFCFCLISIGLFSWLTVVFRNIFISMATLFACVFFYYAYKIVCYTTKLKFGQQKSLSRFHAAEHMVINAYRDLQRVPTMEEIKNSSRFSKYCGSMDLLNPFMITLLLILCFISGVFLKPIFYLPVCIFTLLLIFIIEKFKLLRFLQVLFTSIPTDLELEVALKGIQAYDDMEKHIEQGDIDFLLSENPIEV